MRLLWYLIRLLFRDPQLLFSAAETGFQESKGPKSLSGADRLLLPGILRDFPDFDVTAAKTAVKKLLKERYGAKSGFQIHNVVISQYLPSGAQKTVVFQAAFQVGSGLQLTQHRATLHYSYILTGSSTVAANCPNCGGALGYGITDCPYCGSRVTNPLGNAWEFTEVTVA